MNNKYSKKDYLTFTAGVAIMITSFAGVLCLTYFANCWFIPSDVLPILPKGGAIWKKNVNVATAVNASAISVSAVK